MDHAKKAAEQLGFQSWPGFSLAAGMTFPSSLPAEKEPTAAAELPIRSTAEHQSSTACAQPGELQEQLGTQG